MSHGRSNWHGFSALDLPIKNILVDGIQRCGLKSSYIVVTTSRDDPSQLVADGK